MSHAEPVRLICILASFMFKHWLDCFKVDNERRNPLALEILVTFANLHNVLFLPSAQASPL